MEKIVELKNVSKAYKIGDPNQTAPSAPVSFA